jgi:TRAP-type C4-dicarboxylate transport system permease small subunit
LHGRVGFLALANTLMRGEHIRVSLVLEHAGVKARRGLELFALFAATLARRGRSRTTAGGSRTSRSSSTTRRRGNDATPLWLPQIAMAAGTVILLIAFVDELVLEMARQAPCRRSGRGGCTMN